MSCNRDFVRSTRITANSQFPYPIPYVCLSYAGNEFPRPASPHSLLIGVPRKQHIPHEGFEERNQRVGYGLTDSYLFGTGV